MHNSIIKQVAHCDRNGGSQQNGIVAHSHRTGGSLGHRLYIFCDGEFFHGKDWEVLKPKLEKSNNSEYWINKIDRNRKRDHEIDQELLFLGWTVIRFWGKDIKKNLEECVQVVEETVFEVKMSWDEYEE